MGDLNSKYQETHNNRFDLANPLARFLQEQQCKKRAKPYGHGFAGQANVRHTRLRASNKKKDSVR
jgi:hypothetical protein